MKQCKIEDKDTFHPDALNAFYVRFEQKASGAVTPDPVASDTLVPTVTTAAIRSVSLGDNPRKVMDPDGVPVQALSSCVDRPAMVLTDIFNLSLRQAEVPTRFKKSTIIPAPKKTHAMCLNDNRPMALTSIIMKCFERLVMTHVNSSIPACLDPLQLTYQCNRSTKDAISLALQSSLEHLDKKDTYVRLLLIDNCSTFNTIIPSRLISNSKTL
eukprot:g28771.t1